MDEFTNSHKSKEQAKAPEKRVEKPVITGTAKTKKKGELSKVKDIFIHEDVANVKSYILMDVLVPAIKKAISDIVVNGIDMILYGEAGRTKKNSPGSKISYRSFYEKDAPRRDYASPKSMSPFDYDDIVFETRGDAEVVLESLCDIIDQFSVASVGDLYDLANVSTTNFTVNKYGWTDLRTASVMRSMGGGYVIKLPKAMPLN